MKTLKILNYSVTILAVLGVLLFIGTVGNVDYYVEMGQCYPFSVAVKQFIIAILMCMPAIIREVW